MELMASDIYELYRPSRCGLRSRLMKLEGPPVGPPDPLVELLQELGKRHEERYLRTFDAYVDLSGQEDGLDFGRRREETKAAVRRGEDVLYQPVLFGWRDAGGQDEDFIVGIPDLLVRESDGYVVCDCKLARSVGGETHPEISRQVELYGWLYEREFGEPPLRLEVVLGDSSVQQLPYDGGAQAMAALDEVKALAARRDALYEPVGRSKCDGCAFHARCWARAEQVHDVALLPGVSQKVARQLHQQGSGSYLLLSDTHTLETLVQLPGIGQKTALNILRHAEAYRKGAPLQVGRFPYTLDHPYAVLDLEGIPQQFDGLVDVYLWGVRVSGSEEGPYRPAIAPLADEGDRVGWEAFLAEAESILAKYGDVSFVHYAAYEKTMLTRYTDRYGDPDGIAVRVLDNLLDLYPLVQRTVVLPDSGYSLKVVERWAGYQRTQDEYGGDWSIATYIRAVELQDEAAYQAAMEEILRYNQEDLEATWAVFQWLAREFSDEPPGV